MDVQHPLKEEAGTHVPSSKPPPRPQISPQKRIGSFDALRVWVDVHEPSFESGQWLTLVCEMAQWVSWDGEAGEAARSRGKALGRVQRGIGERDAEAGNMVAPSTAGQYLGVHVL